MCGRAWLNESGLKQASSAPPSLLCSRNCATPHCTLHHVALLTPAPPAPLCCPPCALPPPAQVRDGVIYMLDSWITVATADKLFPAVAEAVANPKCLIDGKIAAMQWCGAPARAAVVTVGAAGGAGTQACCDKSRPCSPGHGPFPCSPAQRPRSSLCCPLRITKVVAEGNGKKGVDSALRAAALGCADKAVSVREAGSALLTELATQLGPEAVSAAVPLLVSADRKLAQEAISKVLGSATAGTSSAAAPSAASSRPATAASRPGTSAAGRPGTSRAAGGRGAAAPAASVPAPVAVEVPAGAILAFSDGKAERARKVSFVDSMRWGGSMRRHSLLLRCPCVSCPRPVHPPRCSFPCRVPLQYRPRPGKFDGISPEEPDLLQRELTAVTSPEWAALLFRCAPHGRARMGTSKMCGSASSAAAACSYPAATQTMVTSLTYHGPCLPLTHPPCAARTSSATWTPARCCWSTWQTCCARWPPRWTSSCAGRCCASAMETCRWGGRSGGGGVQPACLFSDAPL